MAASGFTPISLYYSTTAAAEPTAGNLVSGELAINIADGKLFYKNSSGNVRLLSIGYGSSTVTPTNGGVQYGTGSALALTAAGSSGQILRSNGAAAPTWADLSSLGVNTISFGSTGLTPSTATSGAVTVAGTLITSNGGTGLSSYTLGDMVYYSAGTTLTKLTIGAANRVMTSSGSAPQWVDSLTGLSSVSSTAFTENSYPVVSQSDIGTAPNEIPLNQYLGSMAYQDGDTSDITVYGVRVGRGAGAVATNTAVGASALNANTTGASNTALGYQSLQANTTASYNTAVGYQALYASNRTADTNGYNTAIGYGSGSAITTGQKNTIIGAYTGNQGGLDIRTASNYIVLSDGDGNPQAICNGSNWYFGNKTAASYWPQTTSVSGRNAVSFDINVGVIGATTNNSGAAGYWNRNDSTAGDLHRFFYAGSQVGSIAITSSATSYVTSSDYRLKNSVAPMTGALAKVAQLKPVTYKWNADGSDGEGFIAHELAEICPHAVTGEKDAVDEEGNPKYQGIDTSFLVATLTAAIQELKSELDTVKAKLAALKGA